MPAYTFTIGQHVRHTGLLASGHVESIDDDGVTVLADDGSGALYTIPHGSVEPVAALQHPALIDDRRWSARLADDEAGA